MIQILLTKNKYYKKKYWFIIQLIFSIAIISIIIYFILHHFYKIYIQEKISKQIASNYSLYNLYSGVKYDDKKNASENDIFGTIEIPKLNIYYPIFSNFNEDLLKLAPCKFYGNNDISNNGNICIAGHNYDNGKFFSNIALLNHNDIIYIYSNNKEKYTYLVTSNYEVSPNDLTPILKYNNDEKSLTLVTCNNLNGNRIIIKAIQK